MLTASGASRRPIPPNPCASLRRQARADRSIRWRASLRRSSPRCGASRSSSTIGPAAGGIIGAGAAAKSPPDGYTLLLASNGNLATTQALYKNVPYDPVNDFAPDHARGNESVRAGLASLAACEEHARADQACQRRSRGGINVASSGNGSTPHLALELLNSMAGVRMIHVPYKTSAAGLSSVVSGETSLMFTGVVSAICLIGSNRLRPLAVASDKRLSMHAQSAHHCRRRRAWFRGEQLGGHARACRHAAFPHRCRSHGRTRESPSDAGRARELPEAGPRTRGRAPPSNSGVSSRAKLPSGPRWSRIPVRRWIDQCRGSNAFAPTAVGIMTSRERRLHRASHDDQARP